MPGIDAVGVARPVRRQLSSPALLNQREGVSSVMPQTMKPLPRRSCRRRRSDAVGGDDVSLTWNLAELCSVIR